MDRAKAVAAQWNSPLTNFFYGARFYSWTHSDRKLYRMPAKAYGFLSVVTCAGDAFINLGLATARLARDIATRRVIVQSKNDLHQVGLTDYFHAYISYFSLTARYVKATVWAGFVNMRNSAQLSEWLPLAQVYSAEQFLKEMSPYISFSENHTLFAEALKTLDPRSHQLCYAGVVALMNQPFVACGEATPDERAQILTQMQKIQGTCFSAQETVNLFERWELIGGKRQDFNTDQLKGRFDYHAFNSNVGELPSAPPLALDTNPKILETLAYRLRHVHKQGGWEALVALKPVLERLPVRCIDAAQSKQLLKDYLTHLFWTLARTKGQEQAQKLAAAKELYAVVSRLCALSDTEHAQIMRGCFDAFMADIPDLAQLSQPALDAAAKQLMIWIDLSNALDLPIGYSAWGWGVRMGSLFEYAISKANKMDVVWTDRMTRAFRFAFERDKGIINGFACAYWYKWYHIFKTHGKAAAALLVRTCTGYYSSDLERLGKLLLGSNYSTYAQMEYAQLLTAWKAADGNLKVDLELFIKAKLGVELEKGFDCKYEKDGSFERQMDWNNWEEHYHRVTFPAFANVGIEAMPFFEFMVDKLTDGFAAKPERTAQFLNVVASSLRGYTGTFRMTARRSTQVFTQEQRKVAMFTMGKRLLMHLASARTTEQATLLLENATAMITTAGVGAALADAKSVGDLGLVLPKDAWNIVYQSMPATMRRCQTADQLYTYLLGISVWQGNFPTHGMMDLAFAFVSGDTAKHLFDKSLVAEDAVQALSQAVEIVAASNNSSDKVWDYLSRVTLVILCNDPYSVTKGETQLIDQKFKPALKKIADSLPPKAEFFAKLQEVVA